MTDCTHRLVKTLARLVMAASMLVAAGLLQAKSLYLIANINANPSPIQTYDIQRAPNHVVLQATQTIPSRAGGAVGLAIDTENRKLFATYENSNIIQLVDATNFADLGTTVAPGARNLAGVVVDQGKRKLYSVDRNTNHLYVYSWDSATNTLTLDGGTFVTLAGVSSAHGLALDASRGRLYIGDRDSTTVRYYSTTGWGIEGSFALATTTQTPMDIAVDSRRNLVYMGNAYGPYGSLGQLVKFDLNTGTETVYTLPGASAGSSSGDNIVGVAVDEDTGNVYATTGNQGSGGTDTLIVFDLNLNVLKNDIGSLGNPTGIAIPRASISFNPLNFSKLANPSPVPSGANLSYSLCYDNLANTTPATNVTITDELPTGTTFVSATGPFVVTSGIVSWTIGPVAAGATQACHDLVVNVTAPAGGQVFNSATISGTIGELVVPTTQAVTTSVIGGVQPLIASMSDDNDPVATGTNLTYSTCVNPGENDQTVNNVQVRNPIPTGTSFVSATAGGNFDGTAVTWSLGNLAPGSADVCVDVVLLVTGMPGTQIVNRATVTSANTAPLPVDEATDIISSYLPLGISFDDGVDTVPSGAELPMQVCYDNANNTLPVSNVTIRGTMPSGTSYVSHTGPATFDGTFITWTIGTLAGGAPQTCHDLLVRVTAAPGGVVAGAMVIRGTETQPASTAEHSTDVVEGAAQVVVLGKGDGGGGSIGALELLLAAVAGGVAAARRWRGRGAASARRVAVPVLLAGAVVGAHAQGTGWYVGLGGGAVDARASAAGLERDLAGLGYTASASLDDSTTGAKVFAGYRLWPNLALEASYVDLGEIDSVINVGAADLTQLVTDVSRVHPWTLTGVTLSAVLRYPVGPLALFAKAGIVRWDSRAEARVVPPGTPRAEIGEKGTHATFGVGASYDVPSTRWTVRGEWERFQTRRNDPDMLSLSVVYRF